MHLHGNVQLFSFSFLQSNNVLLKEWSGEYATEMVKQARAASAEDVVTKLRVKERSLLKGFSIELRLSAVLCHSYSPIKPHYGCYNVTVETASNTQHLAS